MYCTYVLLEVFLAPKALATLSTLVIALPQVYCSHVPLESAGHPEALAAHIALVIALSIMH